MHSDSTAEGSHSSTLQLTRAKILGLVSNEREEACGWGCHPQNHAAWAAGLHEAGSFLSTEGPPGPGDGEHTVS